MIFRSRKNEIETDAQPEVSAQSSPAPLTETAPEMAPHEAIAPADGIAPATAGAEDVAKVAEMRARLHENFGKIALAMMTVPRYRGLALADLSAIVVDPLVRGRIVMAQASKPGEPATGALAAIAIWASVSPEVNDKIVSQIRGGTFPVRLDAADWTSGDIPWLLDVIAPSKQLTAAVIANLGRVVPTANLRLHPIVAKLVDAETLEKMGAKPMGAGGEA